MRRINVLSQGLAAGWEQDDSEGTIRHGQHQTLPDGAQGAQAAPSCGTGTRSPPEHCSSSDFSSSCSFRTAGGVYFAPRGDAAPGPHSQRVDASGRARASPGIPELQVSPAPRGQPQIPSWGQQERAVTPGSQGTHWGPGSAPWSPCSPWPLVSREAPALTAQLSAFRSCLPADPVINVCVCILAKLIIIAESKTHRTCNFGPLIRSL